MRTDHPQWCAWLAGCLVTLGCYVATGWFGVLLLHQMAGRAEVGTSIAVAIPWLPAGCGVAGLLYYGRRAWPAVFVGSLVVWGVIQDSDLALTTVESAGEALSIVLVVSLLRAWGFRPGLDRYQDSLLLLAALAIGRTVSSAIDALAVIAAAWLATTPRLVAGLRDAGVVRSGATLIVSPELLRFAARWWANTVAGGVLVVPLLALRGSLQRMRRPQVRFELALLGTFVVLWMAAALVLPAGTLRPALLLGGLLLVVWAVTRFGVGVAAAVALGVALCAAAGFGLRLGTFARLVSRERLEVAWGFIGLLSGTALLLTALLAQRERTRRAIVASTEHYRRLFLSNPYPMWVEEAVSSRVLVANTAALRVYGYDADRFLQLRSSDLRAERDAVPPARELGNRRIATVERHRTARGTDIDVEVTRATVEFAGSAVRVCFIEPLTERNAMRLAVLSAGDVERFRLGSAIHDRLQPRLERIAHGARRLAAAAARDPQSDRELLAVIAEEARRAGAICRQLTLGASPLQYADDDLVEALRRLPASLPDLAAAVEVTVASSAPLALSVERRDHIYRLAEEAVRSAVGRGGARHVRLALEITATSVRIVVDDDGAGAQSRAPGDELALRSIAARAVAAEGHVQVGPSALGGTMVHFECELQPDRAAGAPAECLPPDAESGTADPVQPAAAAAASSGPAPATLAWLRQVVMLALAYYAAAALGYWFLREIDSLNIAHRAVRAMPWFAGGVAIAGMLVGGTRLWPALAVGYVAVWRGLAGEGWATVLIAVVAQAVAAVVTVRLLRRFGFRRSFDRFQDIVLLLGAAAIGRALIVPADLVGLHMADAVSPLGVSAEMRAVLAPAQSLLFGLSPAKLDAVARWWLNGVAGVVLVVPALTVWSAREWDNIRHQGAEFLLWSTTLAAVAVMILMVGEPEWRLPVLGLGLAVVTSAAVRFGSGLASTATLLLSLVAAASYGLAQGTLAPAGPEEGLGILWGFILLLAATAQVLTALLAESNQAERSLQQVNRRYVGLFHAVPHPLFAYARDTGRIRLANREALRRYGYTADELRHMALRDLDADPTQPVAPVGTPEPVRVAGQHRTRAGDVIDVELSLAPVDIDGEPGGLCFAIDVSERNRLRTRMLAAADRERRTLARAFHDGLGQVLTGLQFGVSSLTRSVQQDEILDEPAIRFVETAAGDALRTCEHILRGVSPLQETAGDLLAALRALPERLPPAARSLLRVSVAAAAPVAVPLELREHLYQIAQEAVTNALKHARARRVSVAVDVTATAIEVTVEDDGIGFDPAHASGGLGLDSLRLRSAALHGRLELAHRRGGGTIVRCVCPQPADPGEAAGLPE
jgi:PAS domain S-box-containing protein